jgi:exopolyphosphatase/guanosine-5'-triphosphate,3'-diphosphate pyrophosphatase
MTLAERAKHFGLRRAEVIVVAGAILEGVMRHLGSDRIVAVDAGLRDGVLVDLLYRQEHVGESRPDVSASLLAFGRRLGFDEVHARQVAHLALTLFDELEPLHQVPRTYRPVLHAAALLHDVGYAVNGNRHHRHSAYLIESADLPGLTDPERVVAARLARFHRRRPPAPGHPGLTGLSAVERRAVTRLVPLLRLADALDRAHHKKVAALHAECSPRAVRVQLKATRGATLELWDAGREAPLFQAVYGRPLLVEAGT